MATLQTLTSARCDECVFWSPTTIMAQGRAIGQCRRHSPTAIEIGSRAATRWPQTLEDDWCGDHAVPDGEKT